MSPSSVRFGPAMRLALLALLAGATSCSAFSSDRETYRCMARNGFHDHSLAPVGDKTTTITGRINVHKADIGPDWPSFAKIAFTNSKDQENGCRCNGISVNTWEGEDGVTFHILVDGKATPMTNRFFDTAITFKITIDPQDQMTVQIGKEHPVTQTVTIPKSARDAVLMSCTGLDVSFLNVDPT